MQHEDADTTQVKARLEEMREALLNRQSRLRRHVEHRDEPLPADFSEQALELENDETMVRLNEQIRGELRAVEKALERLSAGSYSSCAKCKQVIERERLAALPATSVCAACAS
jgi:RNA polymerase-binding transcription factor DksA